MPVRSSMCTGSNSWSTHVSRRALVLAAALLATSPLATSPLAAQDSARGTAAVPAAKSAAKAPAKGTTRDARVHRPAAKRTADTAKVARPARPPRPEPVWPVKGPEALPGALLPNKRIVAYYGNPLSKQMGILGELPSDQMLARLERESAAWAKADPATPVQPALHLIAVVAQGAPGRDGKYRLRMDSTLIEKVYGWAKSKGAILFLDVQVGHATLQEELPRLERFLSRPDVHLGVDPEFSMHYGSSGRVPGSRIGTLKADDVNYASRFLAGLVDKYKIPPKVLVVHRFTRTMLPNAEQISLDRRVQVVINMDGWGPPPLKKDSYHDYVYLHPVQYTGFKLFYKNDTKKGHPIMKPEDVLALTPKPLYIQYQ
jgi:hypothetical protein